MQRHNKRLVVCCDGTWNEPNEKVHDNPAEASEPTRLRSAVVKTMRHAIPHTV